MSEFWPSIWRSPLRAGLAGFLLSVCIASVLYTFNWHTFYDTQRNFATLESERIAADVRGIAIGTGAGAAPGQDDAFRSVFGSYAARRKAFIRVSRGPVEAPVWVEENASAVDPKRTPFVRHFELGDGLALEIREGIRPSLAAALVRAFTFSMADYRADPQRWHDEHLYNRSMPLYGYLLTILVVGFGTIRALHRDQVRLGELHSEAKRITRAFDALEVESNLEIASIRARVTETEHQRDVVVLERERLAAEITAVEQEYGELENRTGKTPVSDAQLRAIRDRKAEIERTLATHDAQVSGYESELRETRGELTAAEELLSEVAVRREDLLAKLRDRNRQIRMLQTLVQQAQQDAHEMQVETFRLVAGSSSGLDADETDLASLEDQLAQWIESEGEAKVNFSKHSRTGSVEAAFAKIDRDFVDRFFTHVINPEYERGSRRTIRVVASGDEAEAGDIVIALDDDAGRTLGLRFALRRGAPSVQHVGFVLALLCRAHCRDFRSFAIKAQ